ncbi:hypothetical protein BKA62DRAFT_773352 [Auriculariales sp. MPI-PUGE-AT-0066]|nr:hypothetical protein BKA62DRAFT_773553 [Auriculariales sp. MPI-PUGE-AT-0066]KAH7098533.1 hypothetical protein BKA62DRAFT_773352 [Auriculariales sp. MPI-PUGE-AT-0066]
MRHKDPIPLMLLHTALLPLLPLKIHASHYESLDRDAWVMPMVPATHTCATVYAIAEKAADLIKAHHHLHAGSS